MEAVGPVEPAPHHPDTHPYLQQGFKYPEGWQHQPPLVYVPDQEKVSKKKARKSKKTLEEKVNLVNNTTVEITPATEPVVEDKSIEQGVIGKPISVDDEVQKMIDANDQQGLEQIYKRIVKELAKKTRNKSTHWGPIKNKNG